MLIATSFQLIFLFKNLWFFNGLYIRLGDWTDVIHNHATEKEIGFSWKLSGEFIDTTVLHTRQPVQINVEVEAKLSTIENRSFNISDDKNNLLISSFYFSRFEQEFCIGNNKI